MRQSVSDRQDAEKSCRNRRVVRCGGLHAWTAVVLLLSVVGLSSAQTRRMVVVQEKAPMFKEASISSAIIKYLEKGSSLNLLAVEDSFYLVSFGGFEGWVIPYSVQETTAEDGAASITPAASSPAVSTTGQGSVERAQGVELPGQYLVVKGRYANLREGPGLNYNVIGRAYQGQKLEMFIKRDNWYRVRLPDSKIGFIREDMLTEMREPGKSAPSPQAPTQPTAAPVVGTLTLEARMARLEQELSELRGLVLEYFRSSGGGAAPASGGVPAVNLEALERSRQAVQSPGPQSLSNMRTVPGEARIIGNRGTKVYHLPSSVFYDKIPEEFRVYFNSEEEAGKAGYTKSIQ